MKEILTRTLTGALFVAAIIFSLILNPWIYLAVFTGICILATLEFVDLFPDHASRSLKIPGALLNSSLFVSVFLIIAESMSTLLLLIPLFILAVLFLQDQVNRIQAWKLRFFILISGLAYLVFPLVMLHLMAYNIDPGRGYSGRWILYMFIFLWTYDTLAYLGGKLTGKHVIWEKVSPGKTWQGLAWGAGFVTGLAVLMARYIQDLNILEWLGFGWIVVISGTAGDFLESGLKRMAGRKDSGRILPGHGGILDRIDSFLFAAPLITLYLYLRL